MEEADKKISVFCFFRFFFFVCLNGNKLVLNFCIFGFSKIALDEILRDAVYFSFWFLWSIFWSIRQNLLHRKIAIWWKSVLAFRLWNLSWLPWSSSNGQKWSRRNSFCVWNAGLRMYEVSAGERITTKCTEVESTFQCDFRDNGLGLGCFILFSSFN